MRPRSVGNRVSIRDEPRFQLEFNFWRTHVNVRRSKLFMLAAGAIPVCAMAAMTPDHTSRAEMASRVQDTNGTNKVIPLQSWPVDAKAFIDQHNASARGNLKAEATDRATVYRPIPVCRLIDTRGFPAFINIAGPLLAGSNTNVNVNGACGIPTTGVAGLSVAVTVDNLTPNNGGFISLLQQGSPVNGVTAVFNTGAIWTATTSNISIPNDTGNFYIHIDQSNVQVVIDVNGYFQDLDSVNIGSQELDIQGNTDGDAFEVSNLGSGSALAGSAFGGGAGVKINSGSFAVAGASIGSGTTAFILEANTSGGTICSGASSIVVIDNPLLNGDENAIVLVTPRENATTSVAGVGPLLSAGPYNAFFVRTSGACGAAAVNHWAVRDASGTALPGHAQFNVLIIKAQ
jgi:hypothetical protein